MLSAIGCPDAATIDYKGYTAANCTVPQVYVAVANQAELDAYEQDFGFDGTKVKNLHVNFNPSGNVTIISPCLIKLNGENNYLDVNAANVCIYGRKGVRVAEDYANPDGGITTGALHLISEEDDAGTFKSIQIHSTQIYIRALKEAKIGMDSVVEVTGEVKILSTGNLSSSDAIVRQGTELTATSLQIEASREAAIGESTTITVSGALEVNSTGIAVGSVAIVKQGAQVNAGTFDLTSGNKAQLGIDTTTTVTGNFHMNAANTCTIAASAVINAGSRSGNCL
ncbi:MAG: hypothetical protein A2Y62_02555 [Candidatus Fischerbacteria bacterium RBG_13_37_8]|uniref:Uncharacterized protein n=1 Tax=Candidatus Fischerbacteria bacterium RBG_13_37_8 TaxID=1817863 RepID=A0A1F5VNJ8_9BACT|nr:MAG: hypothetical protein A2Y62_02555 [Candidatus Fischerbacteria bacterium RBG_13_37_8]